MTEPFDQNRFLSPRYWRARAEEVRTMSEGMLDPHTKFVLEDMADGYEKLAKRAEWRAEMERTAVQTSVSLVVNAKTRLAK